VAEVKTVATRASVPKHLAEIPDDTRRRDARAVCSMMKEVTGEKPVLWGDSMVGFGTQHFKYASGREGDWPLVAFAARKDRLTVYLMDGFDRRGALLGRLGKHTKGKSCLHIRRLSDIEADVLRELVEASFRTQRRPPA
jgi:hypothetical protein